MTQIKRLYEKIEQLEEDKKALIKRINFLEEKLRIEDKPINRFFI
ncbi:MAG: hypothetical protein ACOC56_07085 [Atribacterota bacterium]